MASRFPSDPAGPLEHAIARVETPTRLAVVQAALLVGAVAVLSAESLGALGALSRWTVLPVWSVVTVGLGMLGYRRRQTAALVWPRGRLDWALLAAFAVPLMLEFLVAIVAPPNTWDSQTYHLSK